MTPRAACVMGLLLACTASAEVQVKYEQLNPASPTWKFKTIPGPSRSDAATSAKVSVVGNLLDGAGGHADVLVNGKLPEASDDLSQLAFLANDNTRGGSLLIDLGKVQPVAAVNSYSWHEFAEDQGARGPQVFTIYGCAKDSADPSDLSGWTKLADVDSRPNQTGEKWNGQHGVSISDTTGTLGDFRYLLLVVKATLSPRQPGHPPWTNTLFVEIDVHTASTLPKAGDAVVARATVVEHVWVVFKTHFDLGYTDLASNVFTKYRVNMMDGALDVIDENRTLPPEQRFVWTVAGWPLSRAILAREQDPARRGRIERAIREGSLAVHALPGTLHTESFEPEDVVRSLHYSTQLARDHGRPLPISGKMTDVPEHSWMLPTVLAHAGIKFMQIGCNSACQYPRFPRLFWWEGPDGSRVLCNYTVDYGSGVTPPRDWPSKNYLAMVMTGDNHGPPTPQEVARVREEISRRLPGVKMSLGTLDDFAKAVLAENPNLPVVRGDTPDTWIHGLMSMPEATKLARNIRPLEPALDSLDTHLRACGLATASLAQPLADAYEGSFLYGEHTWGMNGEYGGRRIWGLEEWKKQLPPDRQKKFLQSFDDHRDYIRKTDEIVRRELRDRLDLLARSVKADGARIVVWNALPWPRSGLVGIPGQPGRFLLAEDVPANGFKTFPAAIPAPALPVLNDPSTLLDTPFFTATFDLKRGGLASLVEKKTGRELVDQDSPYALGQFLHERFSGDEVGRFFKAYSRMPGGWALDDLGKPGMPESGSHAPVLDNVNVTAPGVPNPGAMGKPGLPAADKAPYRSITPDGWGLVVSRSAVADMVTLTARDTRGLAKGFALLFTFPRHTPYVDVEWTVADKTPDKLPEGGWLCFPFAIARPQFTLGRPGGPVDPARDIIPGANRHLYAVATGVSIAGADGAGISLCPIDSPLVSLDKPGLWWWSMDFVPRTPTVFVNLYNNKWNTNFPLWQDGSWSERVRLWPGADLVVPAWEARVPLLAASADGPAGKVPTTLTGLSVSRPGVLVTAFGANPDGAGTLLRVWDQSGVTGRLTVQLPVGFPAVAATPVDLRGEKVGAAMRIKNGQLAFDLHAYAPASFVITE